MWDLKNGANELIYKTEKDSDVRRIGLVVIGGLSGEEDKFEDWDQAAIAIVFGRIDDKDLL